MVTLAGTQSFNEFELHARAILNIQIPQIDLHRNGASAVVLATETSEIEPVFTGLDQAAIFSNSDLRLFGKPTTRPYRRMAVTLTYGNQDVKELVEKAQAMASLIEVK
jgi:phosphoribosylglycinamide formyltransferase 2